MSETDSITRAANVLWDAWQSGTKLTALPEELRPNDDARAMAIQHTVSGLVGGTYGWKVGATSPASQAALGVEAPIAGALHERFRFRPGDTISLAGQTMRVAEPEFAFTLARDIDDASATIDDVLAAVDSMWLAIEVPDSRYQSFAEVDGPQILADGACTSAFVLGPRVDGWRKLDLPGQAAELHVNGQPASEGSGASVLGDPLRSLHWLAAELPRFGKSLHAGDIVTTGTAAPPAPITPGDTVVARFPGLSEVSVRFAD